MLTQLALVAALVAGPERALLLTQEHHAASDGASIDAPYNQLSVVTIAGPNGASLVLWRDLRQETDITIVATRISATGEILRSTRASRPIPRGRKAGFPSTSRRTAARS